MTKILIADSSAEARLALTEQLQEHYIVRSCCDGAQALSLLDSFSPDLLIVDLMLQRIDGLGVMQTARKQGCRLPILATSAYFPDYALNLFPELNVAYAMLKPCNMDVLLERIGDLVRHVCPQLLPARDPYSIVTATLLELGMKPNLSGFQYCRDAILMLQHDSHLRVTKEIYPVIARQYVTGATAVEKSIRDAIAATWKNTDRRKLELYFSPAPNGQIPRPSNHVFLSTVTEKLFSVQRNAK